MLAANQSPADTYVIRLHGVEFDVTYGHDEETAWVDSFEHEGKWLDAVEWFGADTLDQMNAALMAVLKEERDESIRWARAA